MLSRFIENRRKAFNRIKPNDTVVVKDKSGAEHIGKVKVFTPDKVTIEIVTYRYESFDAKMVTLEKVN